MPGKSRRNIGDNEVALIKAMLDRGMPNDEIHYYFNRLDRLISPGRISQIKNGRYAPEVPAATPEVVELYISDWHKRDEQANKPPSEAKEPTHPEVISSLFEKRDGNWFVKLHETEVLECKESFRIKPEERFAKVIKAIAGLANNKGGHLLFGIKELDDKSLKVVGLPDNSFAETDPATINRTLLGALSPSPRFRMATVKLDGCLIGIIHVEEHVAPPVMALKNIGGHLIEGGIYFRYVGETRLIRPPELWELLAYRERKALEKLSESVSQIAAGRAIPLDLDTGHASGPGGELFIDGELLNKLQFIREGDFNQKTGSPTLRLVGDVKIANQINERGEPRIQLRNITSGDVLRSFLLDEDVVDPIQYILHNAHSSRKWLPIWRYIRNANITAEDAIELLQREKVSRPIPRNIAIERLKGSLSAYRRPTGRPLQFLQSLSTLPLTDLLKSEPDSVFIHATQGLTSEHTGLEIFRQSLLVCLDRTDDGTPQAKARLGAIYPAACRLDELLYK